MFNLKNNNKVLFGNGVVPIKIKMIFAYNKIKKLQYFQTRPNPYKNLIKTLL